MSGEPQPADAGDPLDRALQRLRPFWYGICSTVASVAAGAAVLALVRGPLADFGELNYAVLLVVPVGLVAACVLPPLLTPGDPALVVRWSPSVTPAGHEGWDATTPEDAYHWFPVYQFQFISRAWLLSGTAALCAVGLLVTGEWALLGGVVVVLAAIVAVVPTRAKAEAFADAARQRQQSDG